MTDDDRKIASERLEILQRADAFEHLLDTVGWKYIEALHVGWLEKYREALTKVETANAAVALDSLRQWQLAEELFALQARYVNSTLQQAQDIRGTQTLQDALLMEQVKNEHSTGQSDRPDPAGY